MEKIEERRSTALELHFSTMAIAVILAALIFTSGTMYSFGTKLVEYGIAQKYMNEKLTELTNQLKEDRADRVTRIDFIELRERVRVLEKKGKP